MNACAQFIRQCRRWTCKAITNEDCLFWWEIDFCSQSWVYKMYLLLFIPLFILGVWNILCRHNLGHPGHDAVKVMSRGICSQGSTKQTKTKYLWMQYFIQHNYRLLNKNTKYSLDPVKPLILNKTLDFEKFEQIVGTTKFTSKSKLLYIMPGRA